MFPKGTFNELDVDCKEIPQLVNNGKHNIGAFLGRIKYQNGEAVLKATIKKVRNDLYRVPFSLVELCSSNEVQRT